MVFSLRLSCVGLLAVLLPCCILAGKSPIELGVGKEFILGFTENGICQPRIYVVTGSHKRAMVTVTTPLFDPSFSVTKRVVKGKRTVIDLPLNLCGAGTEKADKGVLVKATKLVSVYGANTLNESMDSYQAQPCNILRKSHIAVTSEGYPVLLVVAAEENTLVDLWCSVQAGGICVINFDDQTTEDRGRVRVRLRKYQTFHAYSDSPTADFSGVRIKANRPIIVISGNRLGGGTEHLTEQMPPLSRWGTRFMTVGTPDSVAGDSFKMVAYRSQTLIYFHDGTTQILNAGQSLVINRNPGEYEMIKSNLPILMVMISKIPEPFMTVIVPLSQYATVVQWATVRSIDNVAYNNSLNVIARRNDVNDIYLDGSPVNWLNQTNVSGTNDYVHVWTRVSDGAHDLRHIYDNSTFMAIASGQYLNEAYGNPTVGKAYRCRITDDPHMQTLTNHRASIPFPCQFRMSFMQFDNVIMPGVFDVSIIEVDISACNGLEPDDRGRYYVDAVLVQVTFILDSGVREHIGNFSCSKGLIVPHYLPRPPPSSDLYWDKVWSTDNEQFRSRIEFSDVTDTGMVEITIPSVMLVMQFQPINYQGSRPQFLLKVGSDVYIPDEALFPATMCSTLRDYRSPVFGYWGHVSPSDAGLYAAIRQPITQTLGTVTGKVMCTEVKDDYQKCTPAERLQALGNCTVLVDKAPLVRCARKWSDPTLNITPEQAGFGIFQNCLRAFCDHTDRAAACAVIKAFNLANCKVRRKKKDFTLSICP